MRIIAGEFRGRRLLGPEGDATRPITDRVKQSLFDILAPRIPVAVVYDCFAGTGSMGLECLSRGAKQIIFFEVDRSAVVRLRKNIESLKMASASHVVTTDLFKYFVPTTALAAANLIFLDPPYRFLTEKSELLMRLAEQLRAQLAPEGVIVFRHDAADRLELPGLQRCDERIYGGMALEFLRRTEPSSA